MHEPQFRRIIAHHELHNLDNKLDKFTKRTMRIQITFSKKGAMRFTGHLDLHRAWERTFRRAALPLAYSHGYNPRPKMNLASALPLGFTSQCEVIDVRLESELSLTAIQTVLERSLPPGIEMVEISEIDLKDPPLQTQLAASEFVITFLDPFPELEARTQELLSADTLPRERRGKTYDLHPLIEELNPLADDGAGHQRLFVRLTALGGATGRPEEVLHAMQYDPLAAHVHRTQLVFSNQ